MYGKLVNGEIEYAPKEYTDSNGEIISNFNRSISAMKKYGYKPIKDHKPRYDVDTQYCEFIGYIESKDYIKCEYRVEDIELTILEMEHAKMKTTLRAVAEEIVDDKIALQLQDYYDVWCINREVPVGKYLRYGDTLYKVLTAHTTQESWTPDNAPSLFAKVLTDPVGDVVYEWEQPDSTNPYMKGDKVLFNGTTYISTIDNNVWSPDVYGWEITK